MFTMQDTQEPGKVAPAAEAGARDRAAEIGRLLDGIPEPAQAILLEGFRAWVETRAQGGTWREAGRAMDAVFQRYPDLPGLHSLGTDLANAAEPDRPNRTEGRTNG